VSKDGQDKAGSDEDDAMREPSKFDLTVDTAQIEREKFKSVRDFFGEDEAVYIMDAKTTGNIGRYLNVIPASPLSSDINHTTPTPLYKSLYIAAH
jgi:transposase